MNEDTLKMPAGGRVRERKNQTAWSHHIRSNHRRAGTSPRGITAFDWTRTLEVLSDPCLDPLFWRAERLGSPSAWWQHVPLAHWIVGATAPRLLVELGTHTGVSYAAFCQAVLRERLATRCHAERAARPASHPFFWEDHDTFSHPTKLATPQAYWNHSPASAGIARV
jgi:hypothetical protein